jgi:hypothetical protein
MYKKVKALSGISQYSRSYKCFLHILLVGLSVLECVGHSFAYVAHFGFFSDVWFRTQSLPQQAGALPT